MTSDTELQVSAPLSVVNGSVGEAIEKWLTECARLEINARLTSGPNEQKLLCGANTVTVKVTPMELYTAMVPYAQDKRFNKPSSTRNTYSNNVYLLREIDSAIPGGRANGHVAHTGNGSTANENNTGDKPSRDVNTVKGIDKKIIDLTAKRDEIDKKITDLTAKRADLEKAERENAAKNERENTEKAQAAAAKAAKAVTAALPALSIADMAVMIAQLQAAMALQMAAPAMAMVEAANV